MKTNRISNLPFVVFFFILYGSGACAPADTSFADRVAALENDPEAFLARTDTAGLYAINGREQAERFLLVSLAKYYANRNFYPDAGRLETCVLFFRKKKQSEQLLEALFLLARVYRSRQEMEKEIECIGKAIEIARNRGDHIWNFYLYDYLSDMYRCDFDLLNYARYQLLANRFIQEEDIETANSYTKIRIGKNYLDIGQNDRAIGIFQSVGSAISCQDKSYSDFRRFSGMAYYNKEEWISCIDELEESLRYEDIEANKFLCHTLLTRCYYQTSDKAKALRNKEKAAACNRPAGRADLAEIEFFKVCAGIEESEHNLAGETNYLRQLIDKYELIIHDLNTRTLDEAIHTYNRVKEKRRFTQQKIKYQFWILALVLLILLLTLLYLFVKRKQVYKLIELQDKIRELEKMEESHKHLKNEAKALILRDFEFAKQIARIKNTQRAQGEKVTNELNRLLLIKDNELLQQKWSRFYKHIDIYFENFYTRLTGRYPGLNEKEVQLCCMLVAGFKTDEAAALWLQSVYSVHRYKTSIRKKLKTSEGADLVLFLRENFHLQTADEGLQEKEK